MLMLVNMFYGDAFRFHLLGFCFLLFFSISIRTFSQTEIFTPATEDISSLQALLNKYETTYRSNLNTLPKENKKDLEQVYGLRWKNIKDKFDKSEIYTSTNAQQYLDQIVDKITQANPLLNNKDFKCYFSRSGVPNASYLGEGVILFNMGLFHRLANESQVAFVICHEIAHFYLQHSERSINSYVSRINSKEVQKELREIKGSTYRKEEQVDKFIKTMSFDSRRHTRQNEHEADSMAVEFLKNTTFNIAESLTALSLLDNIDSDSMDIETSLKTTLNTKDYPFQNRWIRKETGLLGGHAQLQEVSWADSLKTHPDCSLRIAQLASMVQKYFSDYPANIIDAAVFQNLQKDFRYEIIEYEYKLENFSRSLFYCLQLLEHKNQDQYLVTMVGKSLNAIHHALKAHRLSKVTDLPSPQYAQNYNSLCQFIQNLYAENIASLSYHFLNQYKDTMGQLEAFRKVYNDIEKIAPK